MCRALFFLFGTSNDTINRYTIGAHGPCVPSQSYREVALAQAHGYRIVHQSMLDAVPLHQQLNATLLRLRVLSVQPRLPRRQSVMWACRFNRGNSYRSPFFGVSVCCVLRVEWAYIVHCIIRLQPFCGSAPYPMVCVSYE